MRESELMEKQLQLEQEREKVVVFQAHNEVRKRDSQISFLFRNQYVMQELVRNTSAAAAAKSKHEAIIYERERTIEQLREQIDSRHEIVVHDMNKEKGAAEKADAFGIRTVPAIVVDGFLLACCKNKDPTLRELHAAGLAKPGQVHLESS